MGTLQTSQIVFTERLLLNFVLYSLSYNFSCAEFIRMLALSHYYQRPIPVP